MTELNLPDPVAFEYEEIPAAIARLSGVVTQLAARLMVERQPAGSEQDVLIDAEEAAEIMGVAKIWLYNHARHLPFAKRISRKIIRFSKKGLMAWLARRKY